MEKKKFRINIIDIIILVLIVCVAVFAVMKFSDGGQVSAATNTQKLRVTFFQEECADYVIAATEIGDPAYDGSYAKHLGVVTGVELGPPISYLIDATGATGPVIRDGYHSVIITTEIEGVLCEQGFMVGDSLYGIGHTLVLYAGDGKYYLRVHSIEPLG